MSTEPGAGHFDSSVARVTQIQAAHRQLEGAIRLHFANSDPILVHAVVASGANLAADLAKRLYPKKDFDSLAIEACGYDKDEDYKGMRSGAWFLKHAVEGADGAVDQSAEFEFLASETGGVLFWAIQNVGIIDAVSTIEGLFQLFFLATRYHVLGRDYRLMDLAVRVFPRMPWMSGEKQRNAGATRLAKHDRENSKGDLQ